MQLLHGTLHRVEQVALVQAVDQVADDFGVCLAQELVAARLQPRAQLGMVLDDPVVHEGDAAGARPGVTAGAVAEVGMRVVHGRRAVGRPPRMGNAGHALDVFLLDLREELRHPVRAAGAFQAIGVHRNAAGVIAAVLEALQALDEDGDDIARGNGADDATHGSS
jgi:hypothetical protein